MVSGNRATAVGIVAALMVGLSLGVGAASGSRRSPSPPPFRWLVPAPAPAGWRHLELPSGGAVLSYPPAFRPIHGDSGSVSVAEKDRSGTILAYLNATSREGGEHLATWPQFRIKHDRDESYSVHEDAHAVGLVFLGGKGSCVIDDYVTRVKNNHYREIACFVLGRTADSVVVAAALESEWTRVAALLERAVAAYKAS